MLSDVVRAGAVAFSGDPAVRLGDAQLTFGEVFERSCRLANALLTRGVVPGEAVASLGANQLVSFEEVTGEAVGGFVRVPLYTHSAPPVWADAIVRTGARALIVDGEMWSALRLELAARQWQLKAVLVRGRIPGEEGADGTKAYEEALEAASNVDAGITRQPQDIHIIRFSAGTTGVPKAIAHTEQAWSDAILKSSYGGLAKSRASTRLVVTPYSHGSGMGVWPAIAGGGCHVIMPKFDPGEMLRLIETYRISELSMVATMMEAILAHPDVRSRDLSSVTSISYGTGPTPEPLIRGILAAFRNASISQAYGQSEVAGVLTVLTPEDHRVALDGGPNRLRSAGRPTATTAVRIEDATGKVLPPGEVGEVVGKSPGVMHSIWGDPEATAQRITPDGWVRTHDMGYLDTDGYLWIVDRMDDMLISGGFNVWPAEIERALSDHPEVREVVVFGVPHEKWGQTPIAVVRAVEGHRCDESALVSWCESHIGKVKRPSRVRFVDEPLPKSSVGKLLRNVARERYWDADPL